MALAGLVDLGLSGLQRTSCRSQLGVAEPDFGQPLGDVGGHHLRRTFAGQAARQQFGHWPAHQLGHQLVLQVDVSLRSQGLGVHGVDLRLGLAHVDDRGGAHLEAAASGGQLLLGGQPLRPREHQRVARLQQVEDGLQQPHRRLAARLAQLRLGLLQLGTRRVQRRPQRSAQQRLVDLQRRLLAVKTAQHERRGFPVARLGLAQRQRGRGPEGGLGLMHALGSGLRQGQGTGHRREAKQRLVLQRRQQLCLAGEGPGQRQACGAYPPERPARRGTGPASVHRMRTTERITMSCAGTSLIVCDGAAALATEATVCVATAPMASTTAVPPPWVSTLPNTA